MKSDRTDKERIKKAISKWDKLKEVLKERDISLSNINDDELIQWIVTVPIYNIGEQIYNISNDLKENYPDLPWREVSGLRHRLVHDYDDIKWDMIKRIMEEEMDPFINQLREILKTLD